MQSLTSNNIMYKWFGKGTKEVSRERDSSILKISIVVPTLNMGDTIEDTILSVIKQEDKNYELIIIDGGSTDKTGSIIEEYSEFITYYEKRKDNGQSSAINRGFEIATGDLYAWINSDDFYLPNAFRVVRNVFRDHEGIDVLVGSGDVVTRDCQFLKHISGIEMCRNNLINWHNDQWILQQSCFWTNNIWKESGGVDESLQLLMDYDLWLKFAVIGKSKAIKTSLAVMRFYNEAKTIKLRRRMREEEAYVYAKHHAYEQLMRLVKELSIKCEELDSELHQYKSHILVRIFKKIGLFV